MSEKKILPVLPLRGLVVFPKMVIHFDVGREKSIQAVEQAMQEEQLILLAAQKDVAEENPQPTDIYQVGTVARIKQILKLPENHVRVLAEGLYRATLDQYIEKETYFCAETTEIEEILPNQEDPAVIALIRALKNDFLEYFNSNKKMPPETISGIIGVDDPKELTDLIAANTAFEITSKQQLLSQPDVMERMQRLLVILDREMEILEIDRQINQQVRQEMDRHQRDYYLREELKVIKNELGEGEEYDDEIDQLREKVLQLRLPEASEEKLIREVAKLSRMSPQSPDASVIRTYLDTVLELPWNEASVEEIDLEKAQRILDEDHFGLEKVKERILEMFAVRQMGGDTKGSILCLVGPPGVGKTSIAKSIARALGRKYVRLSLGGVKDEAEIRGHRKTYLGSMPGRIISAIKQAGVNNPLLLLDEIDKLGNDYKGDPASAMLEVLDSEQNFEFRDHYIEIPFDLSDVLFLTTANDASQIPAPLRDRMDLIELSGYTSDEKIQIAMNHLIPKQLAKHALKNVAIEESAVARIIQEYVRESGVRSLERNIEKLCRKAAKILVEGKQKSVKISSYNLEKYLGIPRYKEETLSTRDEVGVVTGLAWTQVGGETLTVEVNVMNGTGKLQLTGSLGDVMKESAKAALSYIRANASQLGIPLDFYRKLDIHIHVPEGAIPKDGPSAGITMATAMVSALTGRTVKHNVAMTGEITLRGRVLPIGGLKEKTLAALSYGVDTVIIPEGNKKDLEEVADVVKKNIRLILARNMDTVLKYALNQNDAMEYGVLNQLDAADHPSPVPSH